MSGTSADGIDVVLCRIEGSGKEVQIASAAFHQEEYSQELRELLLRNAEANSSDVREITLMDTLLAERFAQAVQAASVKAGWEIGDLDLIGSHGHTIHHLPDAAIIDGSPIRSTFQIGSGAVLSARFGVPVVSNFRQADVALGGQGAPLVPYFDWATLTHPERSRLLLNLGGIANITFLPKNADQEKVIAFDTGPANMVIDALTDYHFGDPYDLYGEYANAGTTDQSLLDDLLADPYFLQPPPKSTGRERFGSAVVSRIINSGLSPEDQISTATDLTVHSIVSAIRRFILTDHQPDELIVSGGGAHNRTILKRLENQLAPISVITSSEIGLDVDAKEALCFALLAHEFMNGIPTNMPSVTGASRTALLGELAVTL